MKKALLTIVSAIALLFVASSAQAQFSGGTGVSGDPYIVTTAEQLDEVRNYLGADFKLGNDIDLTDYLASGGGFAKWGTDGWLSIGDNSSASNATRFAGTFDGDGHTISGLTIDRPATNFIGLFGYTITSAKIENLGVNIGPDGVIGQSNVGGLVGFNVGTISNCYATGNVSGTDITTSQVGGLVGYNSNGTISNSYATGDVSGINIVGGLVGFNTSGGTISGSYAIGAISGTSMVGGLVGGNIGASPISNSYATGAVSGSSSVGGFIGSYSAGTLTNNFFDNQTTGQSDGLGFGTSSGVDGATTEDMKDIATYPPSWVFPGTWGIDGGYPYLQSIQNFTVTFDEDGGSPVADVTVNIGVPVDEPMAPSRLGYNFDKWYDGTTAWDFDTPITANTALKAKWTAWTQPNGFNICEGSLLTLSFTVTGTGFSFQWYKDGTAISGATSDTYTKSNIQLSDEGDYHIVVTDNVNNTYTSQKAIVTVVPQTVIVTNLRDMTSGVKPAALRIEATGANLTYQWYFGIYNSSATAIAGATSASVMIQESGYYHVKITGACGIVSSDTAYVTFDLITPVIQRSVTLPKVQGIVTNPLAGIHYVPTRTDFVFEMWPVNDYNYSLRTVKVTTDRGNDVVMEPVGGSALATGNERVRVTVKNINAATTTIVINGVTTGIEQVGNHKFTAYPSPTDGPLTITGLKPGTTVRLYNIVGTQVTTLTAEAETITIDISHLARGLYLLHADGKTVRVIKN